MPLLLFIAEQPDRKTKRRYTFTKEERRDGFGWSVFYLISIMQSFHNLTLICSTVYETSLLASIAFQNSFQALSSLTHLVELYTMLVAEPPKDLDAAKLRLRAQTSAVISLLFHLEKNLFSQREYYAHIKRLNALELDWDCQGLRWVIQLRSSIASRSFSRISAETSAQKVESISKDLSNVDVLDEHLMNAALRVVVDGVRRKLQTSVWMMVRSAYREFNLSDESTTGGWLSRLLMLDSTDARERARLSEWMKDRRKEGHCLPKEGLEGRWTLRRPVS